MARRSDHTKEELRALILQSALEVLQAEGFAGLSARKIAERAGYTVGTLYHQYANLDDILLHVNATTLDLLAAKLRPVKDVEGLVEMYVQFTRKEQARWTALTLHELPASEFPDWYRTKIEGIFDLFEGVLAKELGAKAGQAAKVIWASIQGITLLGQQGKLENFGAGDAKQLIRSLVLGYIKGIK